MVKKHYYNQANRDEWLALRRELSGIGNPSICRIGASDTAAVLGQSKYKAPIRIFYELLGRVSGDFGSEKTANGLLIEEHIRNRYMYYSPNEEEHVANMMTRKKVNKVRNCNYIAVSSKFNYIAASLDLERPKGAVNFFTGEIVNKAYPIDMKNLSFYSNGVKGNKISKPYELQMFAQMIATEATYSELCVLTDGWQLTVHPVEYIAEEAEYIKSRIAEFCQSVIKAKPLEEVYQQAKLEGDYDLMSQVDELISSLAPDVIGIEDEIKFIEENLTSEVDDSILADDVSEIHYNRYKKALRIEKIADKIKTTAKAKLVDIMGEYKYMVFNDHKGKVSHYKSGNRFYWGVK